MNQSKQTHELCSSSEVVEETFDLDKRRIVWHITEPDAPGLFALVYEENSKMFPATPESDVLMFVTYKGHVDRPIGGTKIAGRPGLNDWYRANIGHSPDEDNGQPLPIMDLIGDVAAHLLLRAHEVWAERETTGAPSK